MVTKDYSKSRMRENCKYGSVRGGQSNLIPSTRLRRFKGFRGGRYRRFTAMNMKSALRDFLPALIVILSRRRRILVSADIDSD